MECSEADGPHLRSLILGTNTLTLEKRKGLKSPRANSAPYFMFLSSDSDVEAVIPMLIEVARLKSAKMPNVELPSEKDARGMPEGGRIAVRVNKYERNAWNRARCIAIFGTTCTVCGFDFAKKYGKIGEGFIEVHHLTPLSMNGSEHRIDPRKDLRPVCSNCHEMLHQQKPPNPPFTIEEMKARISS